MNTHMHRENLTVQRERALLVTCLLPGNRADRHDPLGELRSLVSTAGAIVVDEVIQNRTVADTRTLIGSGKVRQLAETVQTVAADVIIFDNDLSPSQIGNIEKITECKVLDRSELILDIFAARAQTFEAKLQVELAQLEYTYPRLRAMWSHLERIAGGAPAGIGTRGPGEQQLEIDRRIVQQRKTELKRQIVTIQNRKRREVARRNKDYFTVGLVGYTNAGKSTLFNAFTMGGADADDRLFATLSTRTRKWDLGEGDQLMLSDTVGFVRDLPHHLIASFKATLEESIHSDLLLIVLDASDPRAGQQLDTVFEVLDAIGANSQQRLLVLNKTDRLEHNGPLISLEQRNGESLSISAKTGQGLDRVVEWIRKVVRGDLQRVTVAVDIKDGKTIYELESRAEVLERQYEGQRAIFTIQIGCHYLDRLRATGRLLTIEQQD